MSNALNVTILEIPEFFVLIGAQTVASSVNIEIQEDNWQNQCHRFFMVELE